MKTSSNGRKFIETFEGKILHTYDDGTGVLTIGYGHTNSAGAPKVLSGQTITEAEADTILASDLSKVEANVTRLVKVPLTQNQFDALVSFDFNTGALGKSSALKALNSGNYEDAANRLTLYNRGGGKVMPGLVRRREAEKKMFLSPDQKPVSNAPIAAGTVIASGATAAATSPSEYFPWIIFGTFLLALFTFLVFDIISYNKYKKEQHV